MQVATIHLQDTVSFVSGPAAHKFVNIKSLNLQLINPLFYGPPLISYASLDSRMPLPINPQRWLVLTDVLGIVIDKGQAPDLDGIKKLLRALRYISGQATIPRTAGVVVGEPVLPEEIADAKARAPAFSFQSYIASRYVDLAMEWDRIQEVDGLISSDAFEVYREVLLDAIAARHADDHTKAILYSAIACESVASTQLDRTYESMRSSPPGDQTHRFIRIKTPEGDVVKDPVFEQLRAVERKRFLNCLHESALYLLGRSLQFDMPQVFRTAHALYRTRNKLAHMGGADASQDKLIPVSGDGSRQALECAISVFEWFGVAAKNLLPRDGMVRVASP